jgi:hypothetical protein
MDCQGSILKISKVLQQREIFLHRLEKFATHDLLRARGVKTVLHRIREDNKNTATVFVDSTFEDNSFLG